MRPAVLAIAAHPDDIEFVMAGTMLRLIELGWDAHYFNIANGCYGSRSLDRQECATVRLQEARKAAAELPAEFYAPICDDLAIFYDRPTLAKVAAVVRMAKPTIVLTHSMVDYMEDHQNTARLAVTATFSRGMPNYTSRPAVQYYGGDVAIYHAQPHGNRTPMGDVVTPTHFVDTTELIERKKQLLATHQSQGQWLDDSQQMGSYLQTMLDLGAEVGRLSGTYRYAEGWRRHLHLGFSSPGFDPLAEISLSVPNSVET